MDIFVLYLFAIIDQVLSTLGVLGILATVFGAVSTVVALASEGRMPVHLRRFAYTVLSLGLFALVLHALIPSQKGLAIIVGGHFALEATKTETAKKIMTIVDGVLDEKIEELSQKRKRQ